MPIICHNTFYPDVSSDDGIPANDGVEYAAMFVDRGLFEYDRFSNSDAASNHDAGADGHVWSQHSRGVHLRGQRMTFPIQFEQYGWPIFGLKTPKQGW